ncbi:MAG: hypothetical protein WKF42_00525 [Solirubrobacteraceae bacterium]
MSAALDSVTRALPREVPERTRRQFVGASAAVLGGMGLVGVLEQDAHAATTDLKNPNNNPQNILNVAATAEVVATIVNTIGARSGIINDSVTRDNVKAAAEEELIHYDVLVGLGGVSAAKKIWVPNKVFSSEKNLLNTLVVGDQIFINAYLIGVASFAKTQPPELAAVPAEFMGAEAVHRALALQSLGKLGNDRVFMKVDFFDINDAVKELKAAGFGFGERGAGPGRFYDFDKVRKITPKDRPINTRKITPIDA